MNTLDIIGCDVSKTRTFREVLTNEAVCILVQAALPGMVGFGEVEPGAKLTGDALVTGELLAIVSGYCQR